MSILNHSPAIVRDGLILCLDAGAVRSYPGTGPELVSNGNFESSFTNYWVIRPAQDGGNQVLTQDSSIVKSGTYSAKIVVGGSNPNYDGFRGDSSGHFTLTNGKRYLLSFDVYPVNDTGIDAYIVAGSTYCGTNVTGLTQGAWNNVELFIDVTATSSSSFVEFQTGSLWGDGTWYFDNVSVREVLWNDLSGNFNNGTLVNAPAFSAESGAGGTKSFDFDGTSDYIDLGETFQSIFRSSFSIGMWVKPADGQPAGSQVLIGSENSSDQDTVYVLITTAGNTVIKYQSDNDEVAGISDAVVFANGQNDWHHIVCTATSGGNLVTYVNGIVVDTTDASGATFADWTSSDELFVGAHDVNGTPNNFFEGKIAIAHVYNRALTNTEIQQNYRTHKGRFGL